MDLELVRENDPVLHMETEKFDFENPQVDPKELEEAMINFMIEHGGVGLSANQVGLPYRVFVFGDPNNRESCIALFNPKIIHTDPPVIIQEEGCLSFPLLNIKVGRYSKIRIRFQDRDGKTGTNVFAGMTARIVQHETDHLDGIVFTKRAKKFHLDKALNKRRIKMRRRK